MHKLLAPIGFILCMFCASALAGTVKITNIDISPASDVVQFKFTLQGSPFHYRWQFSPDKKHLRLVIDHAVLATSLPKSALSSTPVQNYQARVLSNRSLQFQFQLKTAMQAKVYTSSRSAKSSARLWVDFKKVDQAEVIKPTQTLLLSSSVDTTEPEPSFTSNKHTKPKLSLADKASSQPIMVVIDPGHGGKDSGAVGPGHTFEKDVVLDISKLLQQSFNKQSGFQAKLTRSRDIFIPLRERLAIARRCRADIFIAIHADAAYRNQGAIGASVFALSERGATSEMARWLAKKENESEFIYGVVVNKDQVLRSVLLDLSQTHTIAVSLEMGKEILSELSNITKLHDRRVEQAAFVVLKSPDIPSLLVETGYISNPIQERKLQDPGYQQQLANSIVRGVAAYFEQHPPDKRLITM